MYPENGLVADFELVFQRRHSDAQEQVSQQLAFLSAQPVSQWTIPLSCVYLLGGSDGIRAAIHDELNFENRVPDFSGVDSTVELFEDRFFDITAMQDSKWRARLNTDVAAITKQHVKRHPILLSDVYYMWGMGYEQGYRFTVIYNARLMQKYSRQTQITTYSPRFAKQLHEDAIDVMCELIENDDELDDLLYAINENLAIKTPILRK